VFETKITEEYDIFNSRELELPITSVPDVFIVIEFVSKFPPISQIFITRFVEGFVSVDICGNVITIAFIDVSN